MENAPLATHQQIAAIEQSLHRVLSQQIIGLYLHGSLAMGCFNPHSSDIDLLAVTDGELTLSAKRNLAMQLLAISQQPHPVEISFLNRIQLTPWRHPSPFTFHYSEDWRARLTCVLSGTTPWLGQGETDIDLSAHIFMLHRRGIVLFGPPIAHIFPVIPTAHYQAAIVDDVTDAASWIAEKPVYGVLNLCRVLCYTKEHTVTSKQEGGIWGSQHLPVEWRPLVTRALQEYGGAVDDKPWPVSTLIDFAHYCLQRIHYYTCYTKGITP